MKIKLQTGSRISIPKSILPICGMTEGEYYDIDVYSDKIIIHTKNNNDENTLEQSELLSPNKVNTQLDTSHKMKSNTFELRSNLDQASSLSNTRYSKCGLIVKTKTKYIDNYCEKCQGKLLDFYKDKEYVCPYIDRSVKDSLNETKIDDNNDTDIEINNVKAIENDVLNKINSDIDNIINDSCNQVDQNIITSKENVQKPLEPELQPLDTKCSEVKKVNASDTVILDKDVINNIEDKNKIVSDLKHNVSILSNSIDNKIVKNNNIINNQYINTDKERSSMIATKSRKNNKKTLFVRSPNTTIEAFCDNDYSRCNNCKEYYNTGFLIDNVFYCRECAQKDFENYIKLISKY